MRYGACWNRICQDNEGSGGGIAQDNRRFINGVFWILRTGAPWRDLPPFYGKWGTVYQRFRRWRDKGIWEKLLEILVDEPDFEWLMIDASHCKVHPHAAGARGGNQDMSRTKGGSIPRFTLPWMQMVCRSEYLSQRVGESIIWYTYGIAEGAVLVLAVILLKISERNGIVFKEPQY